MLLREYLSFFLILYLLELNHKIKTSVHRNNNSSQCLARFNNSFNQAFINIKLNWTLVRTVRSYNLTHVNILMLNVEIAQQADKCNNLINLVQFAKRNKFIELGTLQ